MLTSDTVWDLTELPDRLAILGGGSAGCELGQAFARLGARVSLVEGADRLLPREDLQAGEILTRALRTDGVQVITGSAVREVAAETGGGGRLELQDGAVVAFDSVLVAVGRTPRTRDLGLASAGVQVDERGFVVTDRWLRTTNRRIWAAGDLTGHPQFTHTAGVHASTAAANAVLGLRRAAATAAIPRVTFTDPEIAAVGAGPDEAAEREGWRVVTRSHDDVDRAVADADTAGFSRLVLDGRGRVVGASLVGPRAGESLAELTLAVRKRMSVRDLAGTIHPYPTYGDGSWNAAIADVREQLAAPRAARAVRALRGLRRRWLDLRPVQRSAR